MTNSWRYVGFSALIGVVLAQFVQGRSWWLGAMVLVAGSAVACLRTRGGLKVLWTIMKLSPWFGIWAVTGLAIQAIAVLAQGEFGRAGGLLPHPNFASATGVALWMLAVVGLSDMGRDRSVRAVLIVASVLAAFLVFASGTRSLALGLVLGVLISISLLAKVGGNPGILRTGASLLLVLAGLVYGVTRLRIDIDQQLFGAFERGPIYLTALDVAALSPWIGLGDNAWSKWASIIEPSLPMSVAVHAHSVPLATLMEGGAIGLAALLVLFILLVRGVISTVRENGDIGNVAMVVGLVALTVQGLVDTVVLYPSVYTTLVLVGVVAMARTVRRTPNIEGVRR